MPRRTYRFWGLVTRFVLLSLAAVALRVLRPAARESTPVREPRRRRSSARRLAVSLSFATLFFAGAAFSAGAGDLMVGFVEEQARSASGAPAAEEGEPECEALDRSEPNAEALTECPEEEPAEAAAPDSAAPAEEEAAEAPAAEAPADEAPDAEAPSTADLVEKAAAEELAAEADHGHSHESAPSLHGAVQSRARSEQTRRRATPKDDGAPPVLHEDHAHGHETHPDPEVDLPGLAATIWLHRALPDPTPPSKRLTRAFARNLRFASNRHRVDWALVLGVLRARGDRGSAPTGLKGLNRLSRNLVRLGARRDQWSAVLALEGRTAFADRAIALAQYHRAVGLRALVRGLEWAKPSLTQRLLADQRVSIYAGGRGDLSSGRIDVRVIVLIRFLAEAHGQVTVSSLKSGHGIYSRPGVVSAHTYGQAVDISALAGKSIIGNQGPGSITEQAVRNMLLLPAELRPVQLISLLGLGGPSFPLANHDDHIHVGY